MKHVDCLSRNAVEEPIGDEPEPVLAHVMEISIREDQWLKLLQREDEKIHEIMEILSAPPEDNRGRQIYK